MIYPKFLEKGDTIGVPAPSDGSYDELHINKQKNAKLKMEQMGYKIVQSKNIYNSVKGRSANAKQRAEELNSMFEDKNINFIICAAGGEFLVECLPYVDFNKIVQNPKFIQGFSDPTGILFQLTTKYDIATIYSMNFGDFGTENYSRDITDNLETISGNLIKQESYEMFENERAEKITGLEGYNYSDKVEWKTLDNKETTIKGRIIGGCLDLIAELSGTKYDEVRSFIEKYKQDGIIWYFDNCDLSKEELIRTLWKFNELEYFKYTKGIVFGRCGNDNSYLNYTMEQTLQDSVISNLNVPIIYDADISHKGPSMTIINGAIATICSENGKGNIEIELK